MTKQEIIQTYLNSIPEKERRATGNDYEPVMPFLIGDIFYNIFVRDIDSLPLKHELQNMRSRWHDAYNLFNRPFFACFPKEQHAEITDVMDSLEKALSNDVVILRSQIMGVMDDMEFKDEKVMSSLLLCHILAQFAQIEWMYTHKRRINRGVTIVAHPVRCPYLDTITNLSYNMCKAYFKPLKESSIYIEDIEADATFAMIAKHIDDWIKKN